LLRIGKNPEIGSLEFFTTGILAVLGYSSGNSKIGRRTNLTPDSGVFD